MIAYILGEFPSRSEYFILNEIITLKQKGINIQPLALKKAAAIKEVQGAETVGVLYYKRFGPLMAAHLYAIFFARARYFKALLLLLKEASSVKESLKALKDLSISVYFLFKIRGMGVTHIHAHFLSLPARIAMIMSKLSGIPFSASAHAQDIYTTAPERLTRVLWHSKFIVTCTACNKVFLDKLMQEEESGKVVHIYHGINYREWKAKEHRKDEGHSRTIRLLTAARLVEKKGIIYLLRAMRELKQRNYDVRCSIIGSGPLFQSFDSYIQAYDLADRVTLHGAMGQQTLQSFYGESDIFILPSVVASDGDRDGLPNVLVESLAVGLPVIATATSAITELILHGQTGLIVAERDYYGIVDSVILLLKDTSLYNYLQRTGRKLVKDRFDIEHCSTRLADLFELRTDG